MRGIYHTRTVNETKSTCALMMTFNLIIPGTAQDRLSMVGGLQCLVRTLRDISCQLNSSQQQINVTQMFELAHYIVKTLTAGAFGHCK